jgi:L-threonylcarbamoyladenylate synthase
MAHLNTQLLDDSTESVEKAARIIKDGGVVAVPTETVYGLAADASNASAVNRIFEAKGRPNDHPLIIHVHSLEQAQQLAIDIPVYFQLLADAFWPGPLTILLKKSAQVLDSVTGQLPSVGIRMPNHRLLQAVLTQGNFFVAAPSANPHKQLSPTTAKQVFNELYGKIDAVLDGGPCAVGLESTIIDLSQLDSGNHRNSVPKILRAGPITAQQISAVLGIGVKKYQTHDHQVPGNIEQHYQPRGTLKVVSSQQLLESLSVWPENSACLWFSKDVGKALAISGKKSIVNSVFKQISVSKAEYAQALYNSLYQLDQQGFSTIYVERPPTSEEWSDVNDRLARASA